MKIGENKIGKIGSLAKSELGEYFLTKNKITFLIEQNVHNLITYKE